MSEETKTGRQMTAEEYLGHCALAYVASPADTPEESVAKALLELAAERLGIDAQVAVNAVLAGERGNRIAPPWANGSGVPSGLIIVPDAAPAPDAPIPDTRPPAPR